MRKKLYEQPTTNVLVIRSVSVLCGSYGKNNQPGKGWGDGEDDDPIINGGSF
ncbi:MAG: hypothetical protein J5640_01175 [Bacteroidales bacterium]|nr:hypothetical protein [Bacteroidales bacterium]